MTGVKAYSGVLVVDDDPVVRRQLSAYIEGKLHIGCRVAQSGAEALQSLQEAPPEVALVDVALPDMSGLDVADLANLLVPRTRIVLMSGYADCVVEANRSDLQVFAVVEKPLPLEVIARFLKSALAA
jgi:DNA-binding NtrC family response regulator